MPAPEAFRDAAAYAPTKAHELVHWSGHPSRLGRYFGKRFGSGAYAFEELVAKLGAAFICADLGIPTDVRADHAAYVGNWLRVLKRDSRRSSPPRRRRSVPSISCTGCMIPVMGFWSSHVGEVAARAASVA